MPKTMLTLKSAAHIRTLRQIKSFRSRKTSTGVPMRTAAHIRTSRQIKSFRFGKTSTGVPMDALDRGRIRFEFARLARRERHRRQTSQAHCCAKQ